MIDSPEKKLCVLLQIQYMKSNGQKVEDYNNSDLFPGNWYFDNRYDLKCDILKEALINKIKIIETKEYQTFCNNYREEQ